MSHVAAFFASQGRRARGARDAAWFAAYVATGAIAVAMQRGSGPSPWYPPVAIGIACLLRGGFRRWPVVLVADLIVSWLQYDHQVGVAAVVAANTTLECVLAAWLLGRLAFDPTFRRSADLVLLVGVAALFSTLVGASCGSALLRLVPGASMPTPASWFTWWIGDALTTLTLLPAILLVMPGAREPMAARTAPRRAELVALFVVTVAIGLRHAVLGSGWVGEVAAGWVLGGIPTLWAAVRFDRRTTAFVIAALGTASIVGLSLSGIAVSAPAGLSPPLVVVQGNLALAAIAGMAIAHLMANECEARRALQEQADELERRAQHLRFAQRAGGMGSWDVDLVNGDVAWSDELFELCGVDRAAGPPPQAGFESWIHANSRHAWIAARDRLSAGDAHAEAQLHLVLPDGRDVFFMARMDRIERAGGAHVLGTLTDVTDLTRSRRAVDKMTSIVESTPDAIVTVTPGAVIRAANASAAALLGEGSEAGLVGRVFSDFIPPERRAIGMRRLRNAFAGEGLDAQPGQVMRLDGTVVPVRVSFAPLHDGAGEIAEIAILFGDLTEQRRLEYQLVQAQKMEAVGRLAGGIAHDFNNMLTAILGFTEIIHASAVPGSETARNAEQVVRAAERAAALTQRLLMFSRRQPNAPEVLEVDAYLPRVLPMLQRLVGEDLRLELRPQARGAHVLIDPTHLEQVLLNLVINARDAMSAGGRVVLETARTTVDAELLAREPGLPIGPVVTLSCSDDGAGMDAATRERIFEPFFTTKEPGRGTGLGLSTVMSIMRECEGAVRVQSEPGVGTTFRLLFPEAQRDSGAEPAPASSPMRAPRGAERLLVVEDDPLVREFLAACLLGAGYQVFATATAELAADELAVPGRAFDMLLTDIVLPKRSGVDLASDLLEKRPELPVLFLSGYSEALFARGLPGRVLAKPFTREALLYAVRRAIRDQAPGPR
jgi:PAS domain S-box-containing protein